MRTGTSGGAGAFARMLGILLLTIVAPCTCDAHEPTYLANTRVFAHPIKNARAMLQKKAEKSAEDLFQAAKRGDLVETRAIIECCPELVDSKEEDGTTPLIAAVLEDNLSIVIALIDAGADVDAETTGGFSALFAAAQFGFLPIVHKLIRSGADVERQTFEGATPLHIAAQKGHLKVVKALLKAGIVGAEIEAFSDNGSTPLLTAAQGGSLEVVKALLDAGADLNTENSEDVSPLMLAAASDKPDVLQLLLDEGAQLSARDAFGNTALHFASQFGSENSVAFLIEQGANSSLANFEGLLPMDVACACLDAEAPGKMCKKGECKKDDREKLREAFDLEDVPTLKVVSLPDEARTASDLWDAILEGDGEEVERLTECCPELIEEKSSKESNPPPGGTALFLAASVGNAEIVDILTTAGAEVDSQTEINATALLVAAEKGHLTVIETLVAAGADVSLRNRAGETALMYAAASDLPTAVALLVDNGADVNAQSRAKETALNFAAWFGSKSAVAALLEVDADPTIEDLVGLSPSDVVCACLEADQDHLPCGKGKCTEDDIEDIQDMMT
ncbi:hypothetical protein BSKO_04368 [Bryopsis sp. KO-2023]|nr:hypothetical protein BSKO_04368 [Bryopsis sp. KO-2023]